MILADTSIWIDHFRGTDNGLERLLDEQGALGHPFVMGELALGNLPSRRKALFDLKRLPPALVARDAEVMALIENRHLHGRGIGYVDAHLLASTLLTPDATLWSRDRRLMTIASELGVAATIG